MQPIRVTFRTGPTCLLLVCFALFSQCSDNSDPAAKTAPAGGLVALIDGRQWEAVPSATQSSFLYSNLTIVGQGTDGTALTIYIPEVAKKKFLTEPSSQLVQVIHDKKPGTTNEMYSTSNVQTSGAGEIEITEVNEIEKTVSGTFKAKVQLGQSTEEITEGSFLKMRYANPSNSFTCKVDGSALSAVAVNGFQVADKLAVQLSMNGKSFTFFLPITSTTGTFDLGPSTNDYYVSYAVGAPYYFYFTTSGRVTISKFDKTARKIEGTLNAILMNEAGGPAMTVTDGVFSLTY